MNYYLQEKDEVLQHLGTTIKGLSENEAKERLSADGLNELQIETRINKFKMFISQFQSVIIYIMLFAVVLSLILLEFVDAGVILVILVANALIGYYQELGAAKSLEALKKLNVIQAKVFREGKLISMESKYLVKGDVIQLSSGDKVPADSRVLRASQLRVEESALTGESLPVSKFNDPLGEEAQIGDQKNMLFASTTVQEGSATAVVTYTAMETEIGKITELVKSAEEQLTPLQIRLDKFGRRLGWAVIAICITVLLVMGLKEHFTTGLTYSILLDVLLVSVALAVAAVPSGLPAVVTIALSVGVKKLLRQKALVRKLSSVETLGSCNVICSDKTGTLTQNEMTVKRAWTLDVEANIEGVGYAPEGQVSQEIPDLLFEIGKYCNDSSVFEKDGRWVVSGNPTEAALIVSAGKAGIQDNSPERIDEHPFDSSRKLMSVLVQDNGQMLVYTKGAPDKVVDKCSHVFQNGERVPMSEALRKKIDDQIRTYSTQALRVLAFAYKDVAGESQFNEDELIFVGLQAMIDPPRPDVIDSIQRTKEAGMRVIMITGDYKDTAEAIGNNIGITGEVLTGMELTQMSDQELEEHLAHGANIFARVIPEHKQRIITALQKQGNIVAMTGDGVNDAPALKKANIGIAVGSGTDAAKEASDFVLLDDSFTNIVNAIAEGRGIYDNIQKAIMHLLSGNLSEILIIFLAVLIGWSLPLTAVMLLWINLVTDGAPALTLAVDPYGEDIMRRKPKAAKEGILPKPELTLITAMGIYASIIALFLFSWFKGETQYSYVEAQTIVFSFVVVSEFVLLLVSRAFFGVPVLTNPLLWIAMIFCIILQWILIYTPARNVFELAVLNDHHIMVICISEFALFILCYFTMVFLRKAKRKNLF